MDDVTASIIVACQSAGAITSINKIGFALAMLGKQAANFAIQFAGDSISAFRSAQDASWKFGKTFARSMGTATKAVQEFMGEYNLSEQTAKSMLTDTASILKGFGFDEKTALKMSEQVSRMGIDLASFTGHAGGAQAAVEAITAAMTGEAERMKAYGTVIRMDDKALVGLAKTIQKTTGVSETQARSMAILEEIIRQNQDAIGDYKADGENWTQSLNNQREAILELKTTVGELIYNTLGLYSASESANGVITKITDYIKKNSAEWSYHIASFINSARTGFELAWTVIKNTFSNVLVVGEYVFKALAQAWNDAPGFFGAVWEDIKNTADNAWNLMAVSMTANFEFWGDVLDSFLKNWKSIFSDLLEITIRALKSIGVFFWEAIKGIGKAAMSLGKNFWALITGDKTFSEAFGDVATSVLQIGEDIGREVASVWEGFEFGEGTKQFGVDVANAYLEAQGKKLDAATKMITEAGKNTSAYLAEHGIKLGDFTSMTAGVGDVIDAYAKRQAEIDKRRGKTKETPADAPDAGTAAAQSQKNTSAASLESLADEILKFRSTSQSAVLTGSMEAARLQSRMWINNSGLGNNNPQKTLVDQGKRQTEYLLEMRNDIHQMRQNSTTLTFRTV